MVKIPKVCLDDPFMPTIDSVGSGKDEGKDKAIAFPRAVPALTLKPTSQGQGKGKGKKLQEWARAAAALGCALLKA